MNLTSTLLQIDLAVMSCLLGLMGLIWKTLRDIQKEAIVAAQERTKLEETVKFYGKRLDNVESWITGNSGFKER
ncbi:MAG: hypothetical protein JGK17_31565 [Microcoleus sp. PH2017_10_PVI_O_A]|uniref:hypothetical protein n=1 Tax=unclassified Microcoleus TaxID=2642155 RepID=UPI001D4F6218|nr:MULTISPECIES: hypothetical protein [unclassified Microcoleus]MCC3409995.1 hypothetical protein [Microcoleus sp. PH2017_10_PVI_O_A]MCC3464259.1 hypothetical protein [Microcoleus sp. PH2017_11_PCY_U_A]MCC3482604.1 hypothetical protein [Microcoleus sp. PH2017_12_PCY_D_A]MCC3532263.1 hypothetical protein [Microcoleus sp. PH2017_21_RUC_O_A]MCC3544550.1 hypothetical protein [Microcoleus sp. PH2017_22_RUC_O_B]